MVTGEYTCILYIGLLNPLVLIQKGDRSSEEILAFLLLVFRRIRLIPPLHLLFLPPSAVFVQFHFRISYSVICFGFMQHLLYNVHAICTNILSFNYQEKTARASRLNQKNHNILHGSAASHSHLHVIYLFRVCEAWVFCCTRGDTTSCSHSILILFYSTIFFSFSNYCAQFREHSLLIAFILDSFDSFCAHSIRLSIETSNAHGLPNASLFHPQTFDVERRMSGINP